MEIVGDEPTSGNSTVVNDVNVTTAGVSRGLAEKKQKAK